MMKSAHTINSAAVMNMSAVQYTIQYTHTNKKIRNVILLVSLYQ